MSWKDLTHNPVIMARTSENGEAEGGPTGAEEKWLGRDGIKQEILIDLDHSSSSIGEKDWSFLPAAPAADITNTNDIYQDTVLFGSNVTDPVNKEKFEKLLDNATRYTLKFFSKIKQHYSAVLL